MEGGGKVRVKGRKGVSGKVKGSREDEKENNAFLQGVYESRGQEGQ